jgi:alpha-tubulin suppressor-like RCC1 family protein
MKNVLVVLMAAIGAACGSQKTVETKPVDGSVILATFTADVDPAAGTFVVRTSPVTSGTPDALYAGVIIGEGGGADTVTVSNDVTTNNAQSLPAPVAGGCVGGGTAYKGYVKVTSNYTAKVLRNVYLVIDNITTGHEACTSVAPMNSGLSNTNGLYYYWSIYPGQTVSVPWSFTFSSATSFTFSGHVVATPVVGPVLHSGTPSFSSYAVKTAESFWSWGANGQGELGLGDTNNRNVPTQVGAGTNWASVAAAVYDALAVKTDGTLWGWGWNQFGQLGLGDNTNRNVPTQVGAGTNWASVAAGGYSTLAVKTDGTLWSWGYNSNGQLGLGSSGAGTDKNVPTQVGAGTNWASVSAGGYYTLAVKTDGTLWSWGDNSNGQLGLGPSGAGDKNSPQQVGTDANWASVVAGQFHALAVKTDGTLWSWGYNRNGQLGLGNSGVGTDRNVPTRVGTDTNWASVTAGGYDTLAMKTDGTLWSWGDNSSGQLGLGNSGMGTDRNVPTQVGTDTNWASVAASYDFTLAVKTDGTLYAWGNNGAGQLGLGPSGSGNKNVPTQVTSF